MKSKYRVDKPLADVKSCLLGAGVMYGLIIVVTALMAWLISTDRLSGDIAKHIQTGAFIVAAGMGGIVAQKLSARPMGFAGALYGVTVIALLLILNMLFMGGLSEAIWSKMLYILLGVIFSWATSMRKGKRLPFRKNRFC